MTISYNWLSEYLPITIEPEKLSKFLTSVGLEVESMYVYENIKGGLEGLVVGEVLHCEQHPNADKLKITSVNINNEQPLQIVCGASNIATGQKVVVATVGTTIYPLNTEPFTIKLAKIRGTESFGLICAEDEIGLSNNHNGIIILPNDVQVGLPASEYFKPYKDVIFEIGLTPNRMDAMSHFGVAKDICAYLSYHFKEEYKPKNIYLQQVKTDNNTSQIKINIENTNACPRYTGVTINNVTVKESPDWLKNKLVAIGLKPINNIVDITNFVLHETGQPLHAFDADKISQNKINIKNVVANTSFVTLDEKERKLTSADLVICDGDNQPLCIAGVFGGINSGIKEATTNLFLECACFDATTIRKTSIHHGLRTDAATRFEKGVDIGNTVLVLQRAINLIKELAGGSSGEITDIYTTKKEKAEVALKYHYLKKLSGKNYHPDAVKRILSSLGFETIKEGIDEIRIAVPYSKPDISLPADIVEEIIRIDGLDNIDIPSTITISPQINNLETKEGLKEKIAGFLVGNGFHEILTNSISNSKYYSDNVLNNSVKMINNLSAELDVLKPNMLHNGLEVLAYNINRKNQNLKLFEIGKTYSKNADGNYTEEEHLVLYLTGLDNEEVWNKKANVLDYYAIKGISTAILKLMGFNHFSFEEDTDNHSTIHVLLHNLVIGNIQIIEKNLLDTFDIKQPVYFLDVNFSLLLKEVSALKIEYKEVSKFPAVQRDLAMLVNTNTTYKEIEQAIQKLHINKLQNSRLFDIFINEKLGTDKKSMAVNFTFMDNEKTLTDKDIDGMMNKIINQLEKDLNAEIRK
jgi:phenylalanyl-tRNA synthetase beta chain